MAETLAEQAGEVEGGKKAGADETPLEFFASICGVLVLGLFALTFVFQNYQIPSGSMLSTLLIGDHVLVDRVSFAPESKWAPFVHYREPQRGDVVVFYKPENVDMFLVKRLVGVPGDRIHLRNGILYRNGVKVDEPYAAKPNDENYLPFRDDFPAVPASQGYGLTATWAEDMASHVQGEDLVVPAGHYFVMGDNRTNSLDGRYWGFVPRENIVGRPLFVYWSFVTPDDEMDKTSGADKAAWLRHVVVHFFDQTRWKRTLHLVK